MLAEDKIIQENLLCREHIDEMYHLFVILCDDNKFNINPLNFLTIFQSIHEKKNFNFDKDYWNQMFMHIDYDKDGVITFQDFIRYLYFNLKIMSSEIEKHSQIKINSIISAKEKFNFHLILNCIFFDNVVSNRFQIVDLVRKFQSPYYECINVYNNSGGIKYVDYTVKQEYLYNTINKLQNNEFILEIFSGLNSNSVDNIYVNLTYLNKTINIFKLISSHYEIGDTFNNILYGIKNLASSAIIDKLLFFLTLEINFEYSLIHLKTLKVLRKILSISFILIEIHTFRKNNDFFYNKLNDDDIAGLNLLYDHICQTVIQRLMNYYDLNSLEIRDAVYNLAIIVARRNSANFHYILGETDILSSITKRINIILSAELTNSSLIELRKLTHNCANLTNILITLRDNDYTSYGVTLQKLYMICNILKDIFLNLDDLCFQIYFITFMSLITRKAYIDDKSFILKNQDIISKFFPSSKNFLLMRVFFFYIKNILLSKFKIDCLSLLAETKTLEFMDSIIETNKGDELYLSEFIDILELCVVEHQKSFLLSNVAKVVILNIEKILRFNSFGAKRGVIKILRYITEIKEPLLHLLVFESDCINLLFQYMLSNFQQKETFFFELYCMSKPNFLLISLDVTLSIIRNLLCSEVMNYPQNTKYLKYYNIKNSDKLVELFKSLFKLWDFEEKNPVDVTSDSLIFNKYQDPNSNLLQIIYDILTNIYDRYSKLALSGSLNKDEFQVETVIQYLEKNLGELKCLLDLVLNDSGTTLEQELELTVITQNIEELKKNLCTFFKFKENDANFINITNKIQNFYGKKLAFYFAKDPENCYRIKDENDLKETISYIILENPKKSNIFEMKLFVESFENLSGGNGGTKYIVKCANCSNNIELKENEYKNASVVLCEVCQQAILTNFANSISKSKMLIK